jgi:carbon-monoxide dehydrogenase small subunit
LAVQLEGADVETIEGATDTRDLEALQKAFHELNALQCGFCTSGILLSMSELIKNEVEPDRDRIREVLSGNICRCTGYHSIVDAVERVVTDRSKMVKHNE